MKTRVNLTVFELVESRHQTLFLNYLFIM